MLTRPRLLTGTPIFERDATAVHVGAHGPVILTDAPRDAVKVLRQLDGRHTLAEARQCSDVPLPWLDECVKDLHAQGLTVPPPRGRVLVLGRGALATAIATQLKGEVARVAKLTDPERGGAQIKDFDVIVCAVDTVGVPRSWVSRLRATQTPTLVVHPDRDGATVGPFTLWGLTACVRCQDLLLAARDETWPSAAARLPHTPVTISPWALAWASGMATASIVAHLRRRRPTQMATTTHLHGDAVEMRVWPLHPACDCTAITEVADYRPTGAGAVMDYAA